MKVFLVIFNALILPQVILGDLVGDLQRAGLTQLLGLIDKAGIADKLEEPFTLFAPSNRAITSLPQEVVQALMEDRDLLQKVLLFHVIPGGRYRSTDLAADNVVRTAEGSPLRVNVYEKSHGMHGMHGMHGRGAYKVVTANGAKVVRKDVSAGTQSIVHVIDMVIPYPPPEDDIPTVLTKRGNFETLLAAVKAAGLVGALSNRDAKLTVFAPNDEAFKKVPGATLNFLLQPQNKGNLTAVLTRHVLPQVLYSKGMSWEKLPTLNNDHMIMTQIYRDAVVVKQKPDRVFARVVNADLAATNGVIHEIDSVI